MSIFGVAGALLALFYIGFGTGYTPGSGAPRLRGVKSLLVGGIVVSATYLTAMGSVRAVPLGLILVVVIAVFSLLSAFGLGRFLGSLILIFTKPGAGRRNAAALALAVPAAVIGWVALSLHADARDKRLADAAALADMQNRSYIASIGDHVITFPGVPALELYHACRDDRSTCRTMFWASPGLNMADASGLAIARFSVVGHDGAFAATKAWCRANPAWMSSVWCKLAPGDAVTFQLIEHIRGTSFDAMMSCEAHWKSGFGCRARHDVAPGIVAILWSDGKTRDAAEAAARAKVPLAEAIWEALSGS